MFRNHELEHYIMLASVIDLKIANDQHSPTELRQHMPVVAEQGATITASGVIKNYSGVYLSKPFIQLQPLFDYQQFSICGQSVENLITTMNQGVEQIVTFDSWFPSLRLVQHNDELTPSFDNDLRKAKELSYILEFEPSWNSVGTNIGEKWEPTNFSFLTNITYKIWDINGTMVFQFIIVRDLNNYVVLPVTPMHNTNSSIQYLSFTPQRGKRAWLNEHYLNQYPVCDVFLTTNILEAVNRPIDQQGLYLANLGHNDWLEQLDFNILRGRTITIINDGSLSDEQYTIALLSRLNSVGLKPEVKTKSQGVIL